MSHQILLKKLYSLGIRGVCYKLFQSYLLQRKQKVKIEQTLSDELDIEFGVPQGTVLGPILFVIYLNDMLNNFNVNGKVICYADDTAILFQGDSWDETKEKAELGISKIKTWFDKNLLTLNATKSKFLAFSIYSDHTLHFNELIIHNQTCLLNNNMKKCKCSTKINSSDSVKYLGVFIDSHLKWQVHINYVVGKVRKCLYKFYQLREFLPLKVLKTVYVALIESLLSYGILVWGAAYNNVLQPLIVLQRQVLKIILHKNRIYPTKQIFNDVDVLTVRQIYIKSCLKYLHKNSTYKNPLPHNKQTRQNVRQKLYIPKTYNNAVQHHVSYVGPIIYNMLNEYQTQKSVHSFSRCLNGWIQQNYDGIKKTIPWL